MAIRAVSRCGSDRPGRRAALSGGDARCGIAGWLLWSVPFIGMLLSIALLPSWRCGCGITTTARSPWAGAAGACSTTTRCRSRSAARSSSRSTRSRSRRSGPAPAWAASSSHLNHEWVILVNLLLLLVGFALLAEVLRGQRSSQGAAALAARRLEGRLRAAALVFVLSSFLDNIAAAMIGGAIAHTVFRGKVHIGYLAAIVAASNAGGAGSVVGDTTTTMMWISGISPIEVLEAYIALGRGARHLRHSSPRGSSTLPADPEGRRRQRPRRLGALRRSWSSS